MENQLMEIKDILELTDSIINRKYLSFLTNKERYQLRKVKWNEKGVDIQKHVKLYHLRKFVYDSDENFLNKLITVVNVAYALRGTIITSIQSDGTCIDFYIGIVAKEGKGAAGQADREALINAFAGAVSGNFKGSDLGNPVQGEELERFQTGVEGDVICTVSVAPSVRNNDGKGIDTYVQGIENLVDSLTGRKYTILTIADPVTPADILETRHGYENIYNYLLPLHKIVETKGSSETISLSKTDTENYVKGLSEGISRTQSNSTSSGYSNGFNLGVSFILNAGFQHSSSHGTSNTDSLSKSWQRSEQMGTARSTSLGNSRTASDSTQVYKENRIIKSMLDKIEKNIERIDECEGYGAFQAATYVIADNRETALNVSGNFISLMKGDRTSSQISAINCWEKNDAGFDELQTFLKCFAHPKFKVNDNISVSPAVLVSGPELTVQMGFPKKSINGLTVIPMHSFGRNVVRQSDREIHLGKLQFMGQNEPQDVILDANSLTSHTFITGSTGSGKSNVIYRLLSELKSKGTSFLVIEPAKGEYKNIFGKCEDVFILGTNDKKTDLLKINPFSFDEDIHVLEHIDRLTEIFNVCWPMYAAMPAVLKEAMEEAYRCCGWNLETSENQYGNGIYPTFYDLQKALEAVIDRSAYDSDVKSNYKGSLLTRVRSLTNGLNRKIFCSDEQSSKLLFDRNMVVDLSRVGSLETKSLLMGILVMKLQEYRMTQGRTNAELQHVTVLEEAHHLLKKTSMDQSAESSNVIGKSVEMLSNAIAEMRTFGEGFIIADQAPGFLDMSVIRNTNTKIILRTPEYGDRILVGKAAGLNDGQIEEISRLPVGVAAVYQNNWLEAVLCQFERFSYNTSYQYQKKITDSEEEKQKTIKTAVVKWLIYDRAGETAIPLDLCQDSLDCLDVSSETKLYLKKTMENCLDNEVQNAWKDCGFAQLAKIVTEVIGCAADVQQSIRMTKNVNDLHYSLLEIQNQYLEEGLPDAARIEINHCLLRNCAENGEREKQLYYMWDYEIRHKLDKGV